MAAHGALAAFSTIGTVLVGLIIATGVINLALLVGVDAIPMLGRSLYGQLLLAKIMLFAAMLGCAAINHFRLTPRLGQAADQPATASALAALRRSIAIETALAILVLALVGWLGTLEPPRSRLDLRSHGCGELTGLVAIDPSSCRSEPDASGSGRLRLLHGGGGDAIGRKRGGGP
jgi:hypothetical protein